MLLAVLPVSLVVLSWIARPHAMRELAKGEIKVRPRLYSKSELASLRQGNFAELGKDYHTHQQVVIPEQVRRANLLNIGPSGSGKTFYMLHTLIRRDIFARNNAIVVFDNQADLIDTVIAWCHEAGREYVVLPDAGFNPLGGDGSARDRAERFADLLSQSAETATESDARYYIEQSQAFVRAMIPLFERAYGVKMMLQELVYLCKFAQVRERVRKDAGPCPEAESYELYVATISTAKLDRVLSGLVATIQKLTVGDRIALHNVRDGVALEACLREQKVVIIREGGTRHSKDRPLGLLYMIRLQHAILARPPLPYHDPGPFVAVYIDEAYRYFTKEFAEFVNTNRKYNVSLHLGFQTAEQLRPDINAILNGCGTWVIHGRLLSPDAEIVADNIGRRLFALKSISQSAASGKGGLTQTETTGYDYLIPPHYIRYLPEGVMLLISVEGREASAVRTIVKPRGSEEGVPAYHPPSVTPYPPATVWSVQNKAAFDALIHASVSPPAPAGQGQSLRGGGVRGARGSAAARASGLPPTSPGGNASPKNSPSTAPRGAGNAPVAGGTPLSPPQRRRRAPAFDAQVTPAADASLPEAKEVE